MTGFGQITSVDCDVHGMGSPWVICVHAPEAKILHQEAEDGEPHGLLCAECVAGLSDPKTAPAIQKHLRSACHECVAGRFLHGSGMGKQEP